MADAATLVSQADRATAAGDLKTAEDLLLQASEAAPEDFALFMKIAALQRGTGRPQLALASVHRG